MGAMIGIPTPHPALTDLTADLHNPPLQDPSPRISDDAVVHDHRVLLCCWEAKDSQTPFAAIDPNSFAEFSPGACYVVLKLFDWNAVESASRCLNLNAVEAALCASAQTTLETGNMVVPLNSTESLLKGLFVAQSSDPETQVYFQVFVWTGREADQACRSISFATGAELVKKMQTNLEPQVLWRLWLSQSTRLCFDQPAFNTIPDPESLSLAPLLVACLDTLARRSPKKFQIRISMPIQRMPAMGLRKLDLDLINSGVGDKTNDDSADESRNLSGSMTMRKLHIDDSMSEEQQKMAQLGFYAPRCSLVVPHLYVSGMKVAQDLRTLKTHGITHVINCAADVCDNYFPDSISYLSLHLLDSKQEDICCILYDAIEFIDEALESAENNVLVHCHLGVSRSVSIATGYLMHRTRSPFKDAFNTVRRARDIASPNIGFCVSLMQWHKRQLQGTSLAVYRVAPHNPSAGSFTLVARLCQSVKSLELDSRGVYVFQTPACVFLWAGTLCSQKSKLVSFADFKLIPRLQQHEHAPARVQVEWEGSESDMLLRLFEDQDFRLKGLVSAFDDEYSDDALLKSTHSFTDTTITSGTSPECIQNNHAGTTVDGSETWEPMLLEYPTWKKVETFTAEDLIPDSVFVLVNVRKGRSPSVHVWVGEEADATEKSPEDIGSEAIQRLALPSSSTVIVEEAGEESDAFWDVV